MIRVLRELTTVQRKIADLQVELQGRKVGNPFSFVTFSFTVGSKVVSVTDQTELTI